MFLSPLDVALDPSSLSSDEKKCSWVRIEENACTMREFVQFLDVYGLPEAHFLQIGLAALSISR